MNVGIVGLGLIGGSFAKTLNAGGVKVIAFDIDNETLDAAMADSVKEKLTSNNINKCDLIILATFPKHCADWLKENAPKINKETIVIDVAGTKRGVCKECFKIAKSYGFKFIGAHPMAGTQFSGYAHAKSTMFKGAPMILVCDPTLDDMSRVIAIDKVQNILAPCEFGFYTQTTAEHHDKVIAYTSQLAHVISSSYANNPLALEHDGFSAGSWKDLTRVAWLNPKMWSELFLENSDFLSECISQTIENLKRCKKAIDDNNKEELEKFLSEGDSIKREAERLEEKND